jgi:hypothetical protein
VQISKSEKLSPGEALIVGVGFPFLVIGASIALLPLNLLYSWIACKFWEWFAVPYFHAPHVGVWLMCMAGWFISMFMPYTNLKNDCRSSWWSG